MTDPREFKMGEDERLWWGRVRHRGAIWFVVHKGLPIPDGKDESLLFRRLPR